MNSSAAISAAAPRSAQLQTGPIVGLFPELLGVGGVQEAGRLTAAALSEIAGEQNGTAEFLSLNDSRGVTTVDLCGQSIPLRGFGRGKVSFARTAISRARLLTKHQANGLVLAAHPNLAVPAGLMQRFASKLKIIVMAHGIEVWNPLPITRRRALLRSNLVLAPSSFTALKLEEVQGISREKIRVLPWPLNPEFLRMTGDQKILPVPEKFPNGRVILTVGRWAASERYKGVDDLIRAIGLLRPSYPNLHLVAAGGGDDLPRLSELARSLGVKDCVTFLEGLTREQIGGCYSRADLFALPSTGEGFGIVFLEAMAFAKPLVGAAFGGTTDVITDGMNGLLVPANDPEKLANALSEMLRNESSRRRMGQMGAEIVRSKYSFEVFREGLRRILS